MPRYSQRAALMLPVLLAASCANNVSVEFSIETATGRTFTHQDCSRFRVAVDRVADRHGFTGGTVTFEGEASVAEHAVYRKDRFGFWFHCWADEIRVKIQGRGRHRIPWTSPNYTPVLTELERVLSDQQ